MRIYLAARYSRRLELLAYAEDLKADGHEVVSTWIDGHHEKGRGAGIDTEASEAERSEWAQEDVVDVLRCQTLICFTEPPGNGIRMRGGLHVEFGIALGLDLMNVRKRFFLVGPRVNVFHCLRAVEQFDTWAECREGLSRAEVRA